MRQHTGARMYWVLGGLLLVLVAFAVRAYQLQVVLATDHLERGDWQSVSLRRIESPRGAIVDSEGRILAQSVLAPTLVIDPRFVFTQERDNLPALREALTGLTGFDPADIEAWESAVAESLPRYRILAQRIPPADAARVLTIAREAGLDGIYAVPEYRRIYPNRELAGATIGFATADGIEGMSGIERALDDHLRGVPIEYSVERDSRRRPYLLGEAPDIEAASGATVVLTLRAPLQRFVEDALSRTVEHFHAQQGMVVVTVPESGEIVAMASWPGFDPNLATSLPPEASLNPLIGHVFEPGSTAKIFTFAAAIDSDLVGWDTLIDCELGRFRVGSSQVRDTHPAGIIPAWEVIQYSSNIGALKMGMMLSQERHRGYLSSFGFGQLSGLGLPGESAGLLRRLPWREIEHANISFGHGFSASPLQINMAMGAIANGGVLMVPRIVREIRRPDGTVLERRDATSRGRVVSEETARLVSEALVTVTSEAGTGTAAAIPGIRVAGKTGTAELFDAAIGEYTRDVLASFTGYLPADDPAFAITVMILRPDRSVGHYGGVVAAPLFREIAEEALVLEGIFPEIALDPVPTPATSPVGALPRDDEATTGNVAPAQFDGTADSNSVDDLDVVRVPDFIGMRLSEASRVAAGTGLRVQVEGAGTVASQEPAPGTPVPPGATVHLVLGRPGEGAHEAL